MKFSHISVLAVVSISAVSMMVGCTNKSEPDGEPKPAPISDTKASEPQGHTHGAGPHGGTIADWGGGKFHVEFTVDHEKKEATVYILGGDQKTPDPIKATSLLLTISDPSFQTELAAVPLEGEADGKSSRFVGTHESLGIVKEFAGTISAEADGTPYAGEFKEEPHE